MAPNSSDGAALTPESKRWLLLALVGPLLVGLAAILLFSGKGRTDGPLVAIGVLSSMAALVSGALTGFLFGIPRSRRAAAGDDVNGGGDDDEDGRLGFAPNTNLEQISDWLTKILVGATITQLGPIGDGLGRLIDRIGDAWSPDSATADVFAGTLLVYFGVFGFLAGWLLTRAFLAWALSTIDRQMLRRLIQQEGENIRRDTSQVVQAVLLERDVEASLRNIGLDLTPQVGDVGPDFVCEVEERRIALEVKHLAHPITQAEIRRFAVWPDTDGCVLVADADLTPEAQEWVAANPNVEFVRWRQRGDEQQVRSAVEKVCQALAQLSTSSASRRSRASSKSSTPT